MNGIAFECEYELTQRTLLAHTNTNSARSIFVNGVDSNTKMPTHSIQPINAHFHHSKTNENGVCECVCETEIIFIVHTRSFTPNNVCVFGNHCLACARFFRMCIRMK